MSPNPITISQLARIFVCVFAGVLPQVRHIGKLWATRGKVLHAFLADTISEGWHKALDKVPDEFREACECIEMHKLPKPGEYAAEVTWAYNWKTDTARELGRGMDRRYTGLVDETCEIAGTADAVGLTEDAVLILDYKTGWADLGPAVNSWQLRGYAIAAARAYKRNRAVVGFIRIREDGRTFFDLADVSAMELDAWALELRDTMQLVSELRADVVEFGTDPQASALVAEARYVEGAHCNRCASLPFCAAKMRLVAQLAGAPSTVMLPGHVPTMSERELSTAWDRLKVIEDLAERLRESLQQRAAVTPFPVLGKEGYWLGPVEEKEDEVKYPAVARPLADRFGYDVARRALKLDVSKASIKRAIEESGWLEAAPGRKITPTMRNLVEDLRQTKYVVRYWYEPHVTGREKERAFLEREQAEAFIAELPAAEVMGRTLIVEQAIVQHTTYPVRERKMLPGDVEKAALPPPMLRVIGAGDE